MVTPILYTQPRHTSAMISFPLHPPPLPPLPSRPVRAHTPQGPNGAATYLERVIRVHVEELVVLLDAPPERSQRVLHGQASTTPAGPTFGAFLSLRVMLWAAAFRKGAQVFFLIFQVGIIKAVESRVSNGCSGWGETWK